MMFVYQNHHLFNKWQCSRCWEYSKVSLQMWRKEAIFLQEESLKTVGCFWTNPVASIVICFYQLNSRDRKTETEVLCWDFRMGEESGISMFAVGTGGPASLCPQEATPSNHVSPLFQRLLLYYVVYLYGTWEILLKRKRW